MSACIVDEKEQTGQIVTSGRIDVVYDQRTVSMFNNIILHYNASTAGEGPGIRKLTRMS